MTAKRISQALGVCLLVSFSLLGIRANVFGVKEPRAVDLILTVLVLLCGLWFIVRGLWLVMSDFDPPEDEP